MTPEVATALLAKMVRTPQCTACGKLNPPTIGPVGLFDGDTAPVHEGCLATLDWLATVTESAVPLPSEEECRDALATVIGYAATIARLERELAARDATVARLTRERDEAAVYSRDACDAVENVRVMLAGTLDALDAARARIGTVEGSV